MHMEREYAPDPADKEKPQERQQAAEGERAGLWHCVTASIENDAQGWVAISRQQTATRHARRQPA